MIARIVKGRFIGGLLYYLYGPGKSDEHVDPHLIAAWRDQLAPLEPPLKPDGKRNFRNLTGLLNAPLNVMGRRGQKATVWHCVLSAAPADPLLTDDEWNVIATNFMDRMGLSRKDDPAGVRWVAVRHGLSSGGIDHIHIAATLARQDGGLPSIHNDFIRVRRACVAIEQQYGLTSTAPADRTANPRPTRAESERIIRNGRPEPPRITLRRHVQEAAAVAQGEADFFARLRDTGALIRERRSDQDPDQVTGYAVALDGDVTSHGGPIWYSGGKLAPDLTLPRLRRRWERASTDYDSPAHLSPRSVRAALRSAAASAADHARNDAGFFDRLRNAGVLVRYRYSDRRPGEITGYAITLPGHQGARGEAIWYSGGRLSPDLTLPRLRSRWGTGSLTAFRAGVDPAERRAIWDDVIRMTSDAASQFRQLSGTDQAADAARAAADALRMSAWQVRGTARRDLWQAADDFDRAAREAYGAVPRPSASSHGLRTAAQLLAVLGAAGASPVFALSTLLRNLGELASATADLRYAQCRRHQAAVARMAAEHLRYLASSTAQPRSPSFRTAPTHRMPAADPARPGFAPQPQAQRKPSRPRPPAQSHRPNGPAP